MLSSNDINRIPVKNLYYMLVYAWDHPYEKDIISVYDEDEKDLLNLLSKILLIKVKSLIKRGLYKEYTENKEESSIIRGKILFKESIQTFSHKRGKMHILEEDMSHDIPHNQLIKATLYYLSRNEEVEKQYRDEIKKVLPYFNSVSLIQINHRFFNMIKLHRNNQHYQFILDVCQFILQNSLLHEGDSNKLFQNFSRDHQKVARLFENFVKNFYRKEIQGATAKSEMMQWPAEGDSTDLLPIMKTDISLRLGGRKIIIDTKFYKDGLASHWNKETVHSAHLYQLFAYLNNDVYYSNNKATGILLYPEVHKSINLYYQIHGFDVKICTVDLAQNWRGIHERLLEIVKGHLEF
ncbi:5-methylcytosine restriction system specificity protein McrC [Paraliobacillus salinarum]|uniref:5-methylcytosine restriction system specificity protein McrC n=1 Tax=Paraliobacillus salinarum TaxID=1158996 RepID=UPI0015F6B42E|nr:restriction endonuclease [Paraliobacillus salinarum]